MMHAPGIVLLFVWLALHLSPDQDDQALARRIKGGDHQAFRAFFDRYHGSLIAFLRRKKVEPEEAENLVQAAFLMIWEKRDQIDPDKSLRAYLFRIGYTRALNHFRDTAKFDNHADVTLRTADTVAPESNTEYAMMQDTLHQAVAQLPKRRRAVFELCFLQGLSYREAAEALEVSIKTVENQMGHALKTIRQAMEMYRM